MIIELHLIQNFAPSNLNRDENGAPKTSIFGGANRARISSQCLKRAAREAFKEEHFVPDERLAARTKLMVGEVAKRLVERGRDEAAARAVVAAALSGLGLSFEKEDKTKYLLFLGAEEIERVTLLCDQHWATLLDAASTATPAEDDDAEPADGRAGGRRAQRKASKPAVPGEVVKELVKSLDGGRAADLALFGRMIADKSELNIEAASQVAHAISTHQVTTEFDFYTAVDDLQDEDETGAGMMGTVEFNSACFYRYSNVDVDQLTKNMGGDRELAWQAVEAYIRASVKAIPSGKQHSMAAQNPPSLVMAVARERGLWSLANAFEKPVRAHEGGGLIEESVVRLDQQWRKLMAMYGSQGIRAVGVVCDDLDGGARLEALRGNRMSSVEALIAGMKAVMMAGVPA